MNKPSLSTGQTLIRLAAIAVVPLIVIALFLWAGGWLTPDKLTSDKLITVLQKSGGEHPGYRRNHAKGVCINGSFAANGKASVLSRAGLFAPGETPVIGRFAIAGGNPNAPDYAVPVRSMALAFYQKDGQQWRTGMNAMPMFPVKSVEGFYDLQIATLPDAKTGKPDPAKIQAFVQKHPEIKPFFGWAQQYVPSSSWASDRFNSLNAFNFVDQAGTRHVVRWSMVPHSEYQPINAADKNDSNFLQSDLQQRLAKGALQWDLIITVADAQDSSSDASIAWPADRQTINAGTLTINQTTPQQQGACNDINYDPLILPEGITASDDPILNARSSAYAKSYNARTREQAGAH
ncbi:catalase family peroxidase [Pantoea rwandensis]|uniref:Catalase-related peroxidase n=1 Tax=Pantoea rwandensis TaxID=1076550 RepID=A0ABM5RJS1_9GAMM|nr:catalase family peroxidase [Pantoea rwandensis]AIR86295.1 catalase [Pantoea rwandensis]